MRIAYLNNHYQLGGAETVTKQLHNGMLRYGHSSDILITEGKSIPCSQGVVSLYPRLLSKLDHSRFRRIINKIAPRSEWTNRAVRNLIKSDYDLIHVHSFHGLYASIETLSLLVRAKPVVWTFHRFWGVTGGCDHPFGCTRYRSGCGSCPQVGNFAVGPVDNTSDEWASKMRWLRDLPLTVVAPSHHLAEVVRHSPIGQNWETIVIHNGIDINNFGISRKHSPEFRISHSLNPKKISLLFTNRNFRDPIKGWPTIRDALWNVSPADIQLMLVGGGSDWAASQLPSGLDVVDYGYISDRSKLATLYEAADIFLYASQGENFPCAILEAMSSGCCVVTTPVDGVLEQLESGLTGFVAGGMDSQSLARCLTSVLGDRQKILPIGNAARDKISDNFTEEQMLDKHASLYRHVIKNHGNGSISPSAH